MAEVGQNCSQCGYCGPTNMLSAKHKICNGLIQMWSNSIGEQQFTDPKLLQTNQTLQGNSNAISKTKGCFTSIAIFDHHPCYHHSHHIFNTWKTGFPDAAQLRHKPEPISFKNISTIFNSYLWEIKLLTIAIAIIFSDQLMFMIVAVLTVEFISKAYSKSIIIADIYSGIY